MKWTRLAAVCGVASLVSCGGGGSGGPYQSAAPSSPQPQSLRPQPVQQQPPVQQVQAPQAAPQRAAPQAQAQPQPKRQREDKKAERRAEQREEKRAEKQAQKPAPKAIQEKRTFQARSKGGPHSSEADARSALLGQRFDACDARAGAPQFNNVQCRQRKGDGDGQKKAKAVPASYSCEAQVTCVGSRKGGQ